MNINKTLVTLVKKNDFLEYFFLLLSGKTFMSK